MLARLSFLSVLVVALAAPASAQLLPCVSQATDPCVINSTTSIPVGTYDIRPKSLSVGNKTITITGAMPSPAVNEMQILAANITFTPGARFVAGGTDGNTTITLDASGTLTLQSQGTSKSKIDVSGNFGGGTINLHSVGDLTVNGALTSNATNQLGYGGTINVKSDTGNVTITGDPSEGIRTFGNAQGGGGFINIEATLGAVSVSTELVAKGGDCSSCEVDLTAGTDITTTPQGVVDMQASGVGDGGFCAVTAGGNVNLAGNILANGSSDATDGGAGGDLLVYAGGSITTSGRVELSGAGQDATSANGFTVDGDGGSVDISGNGDITITGPMFGISKGFGQGDEFSYDTTGGTGNLSMQAEVDMSGDNFGGDITVLSNALVTVTARLRSATPVDALHPAALGGTVDIEGCQVNVTSTGQVICTGPGGNPSGSNFFAASTGLTIAGTVTATDTTELDWRTSAPIITGTVTPPATLVQNPFLPCCGVQCTTTTTTSTSTTQPSTTSTSSSTTTPSTTSTSVTIPTTTTTSIPVQTTTSTSIIVITTTSTSIAPTTTTTSTTAPPTTTTTSLPATTTTTTTLLGSTTTSTTTLPGSTTSTTVPSSTTTTSTTLGTTSTSTSTVTSTSLVTTTSTSPVVSTSTTTTPTQPIPTTTTQPSQDCTDTAIGLDAVRCRLDLLTLDLANATDAQVGNKKIKHGLQKLLTRATSLTTGTPSTRRLKKAAKEMKSFAARVQKGLDKGRMDPAIGAELSTLANEAQTVLAGLSAS